MAKYFHNKEQNGIELYFDGKPEAEILTLLKTNKWRWNPKKSCWYNKYSKDSEDLAIAITQDNGVNDSEAAINERLLAIIQEVIRDFGVDVFRNRIKASGIFSDLMASFGREKYIARMAIKEGAVDKLLSAANEPKVAQKIALDGAAKYMYEELGMDYKFSYSVLMTFQEGINKG